MNRRATIFASAIATVLVASGLAMAVVQPRPGFDQESPVPAWRLVGSDPVIYGATDVAVYVLVRASGFRGLTVLHGSVDKLRLFAKHQSPDALFFRVKRHRMVLPGEEER